ncbi:MAG TPA: hypothetical protein VFZ21_02490 [Gemmatimonadaceae bacterium]|jgi:hypothetical protein|nr:hypothetical protein [Gemmatimonadaceae bacterium]
MSHPLPLKAALKRGALVAAANWPLVVVQFIAEAVLKLLLAVPVIGGLFLVVLLLGAEIDDLLAGGPRDIIASVFAALRTNPVAFVAFGTAFLLVLLAGSALTFVVKGGTMSLLADAEATAGALERPPLRLDAVRRANRVHIDPFLDGCKRLWRRYLRLGGCLLIAYTVTAIAYLVFIVAGYALANNTPVLLGLWTVIAALASGALVVWITLINLFYLLTQMIVAVENVSVRAAATLVVRFLRASLREIAAIFGVVLLLVGVATIASVLATAGLGLIAFVPLAGLAVLPLQVAAWLMRGFVFQYLALTALGAYLAQYRLYARAGGVERNLRIAQSPTSA